MKWTLEILRKMNLKTVAHIVLCVVLMILETSCNTNGPDISSETKLMINNFEITEFELIKDYQEFLALENIEKPGREHFEAWKNDYIDDIYLLIDAYEKQYDTIKRINGRVEQMANYMLAKTNGYLWNHIIEPELNFSSDELKYAYSQREFQYFIETFVFQDTSFYFTQLHNKLQDTDDQIEIRNILTSDSSKVIYNVATSIFPFIEFIEYPDFLDIIEEKRFTGPYLNDGLALFFKPIKKEKFFSRSYSQEKESIYEALKQYKSAQIIIRNAESLRKSIKKKYNEYNINILCEEFLNNSNLDTLCSNIGDYPLLEYVYKSDTLTLNIIDYLKYRRNLYFVSVIDSEDIIKADLQSMIIEQFFSDSAKSLGLDTLKKFVLEKRNFRNKLILNEYISVLYDSISEIAVSELKQYYQQNANRFLGAEKIDATLFYFNSFKDANRAITKINQTAIKGDIFNFYDSNYLVGLEKITNEEKIDRNCKLYPTELVVSLFNNAKYNSTKPYLLEEFYVVAYKKEEYGTALKPFSEVTNQINNILRQTEFLKYKKHRIEKLKRSYKIEIDLINSIERKL